MRTHNWYLVSISLNPVNEYIGKCIESPELQTRRNSGLNEDLPCGLCEATQRFYFCSTYIFEVDLHRMNTLFALSSKVCEDLRVDGEKEYPNYCRCEQNVKGFSSSGTIVYPLYMSRVTK